LLFLSSSHQEWDNPRKRKTAHLAIKTNGYARTCFPFGHIAFSATTVVFHSVGAFSFLSFLPLDVLMQCIVSKPIIKFNKVQKKKN
jgi:hypothetical protein